MDNYDIKTCPNCNTPPMYPTKREDHGVFQIVCSYCGTAGQFYDTTDEAITAWNKFCDFFVKDCPACLSDNVSIQCDEFSLGSTPWQVICTECDMRGPRSKTKKGAIDSWSNLHGSEAIEPVVIVDGGLVQDVLTLKGKNLPVNHHVIDLDTEEVDPRCPVCYEDIPKNKCKNCGYILHSEDWVEPLQNARKKGW